MFKAIILKAANVEGNAPEEIQIVPLGEYTDGYGRTFRVMEEDVEAILATAAFKTNDQVIDYEHQTLSGKEAPAAGWVKELINKGKDGIWGVVEWTERAKEYFKNKEYRYLSPVLLSSKKDPDGFYRPSIFHSAGLTNTPQIDGMVPIVNKLDPQNMKEEGHMKRLFEALGLPLDATEDQALEALTVLKNKAETPETKEVMPKDVIEALGLKEGASVSEAKATILAMKQPGNVIDVAEFQKMKKDLAEKNRDELVTLAMKEGKITAAQKEWAEEYALNDPDGFNVFVNKAPQVVPMNDAPKGGEKKPGELDETQALVNKQLGIDEETWKKHNAVPADE